MHKHEILRIVKEHGWRIVRDKGTHFIVEKDGVRSGFGIVGSNRGENPEEITGQIFRKLGIDPLKDRKLGHFHQKAKGKLAPLGTYGYELYAARESKKISVSDLATAIGIDAASISNYEANRYMPKPDVQEKLATMLMWPALHVVKSIRETITDVGTIVETGKSDEVPSGLPKVKEDLLPIPVKRHPKEMVRIGRKKRSDAGKPRKTQKTIQKLALNSTVGKIAQGATIEQRFDAAMLEIRVIFIEMVEKAKKWDAIKELIAEE